MHDRRLLLDAEVRGPWARAEDREDDHLDVGDRLGHEARDVAGQDRLRQVGQGSDESYGPLSPTVRPQPRTTKPAFAAGFGLFSGEGEIRTLGPPLRRTTVFETAAFDRSATSPSAWKPSARPHAGARRAEEGAADTSPKTRPTGGAPCDLGEACVNGRTLGADRSEGPRLRAFASIDCLSPRGLSRALRAQAAFL